MTTVQTIFLFLTILFSALVAGLLYGYSCSVNIGLKALPDEQYLRAMQSINKAIQNPWFFISFMGLVLLFPITAWLLHPRSLNTTFYYLLFAAVIYLAGVFAVTIFGNVPLNNTLENFNLSSASAADIAAQRKHFEMPWNRLHLVRTIAAVLSLASTIIYVLKSSFNH